MMKKINKLISVLVATLIIFSAFCFNVAAADSLISLSSKNLKVGDSLTVTVTIRGGEEMYATEAYLDYNSGVLEYVSGTSSNLDAAGVVHIVGTPGGASSQSYSIVFTAKAEGNSSIVVRNVKYVGAEETNATGSSASITVASSSSSSSSSSSDSSSTTNSTNASLSSLKVSGATLSPAFNANTTSYTAKVPFETEKISITANAVDGGTFTGGGTFDLNVGDNVRYIKVTAADGKTTKTYKVTIVRAEEGEEVDPTEENPLNVKIDDVDYSIVPEAPETVLEGFTVETVLKGDIEVSVQKSADSKLVIYTLKNVAEDRNDYFTYNEKEDKFELLPYAVIGNKMYIFVNQEGLTADGYTKTTLSIGNSTVDAFVSNNEQLFDFYVVYCYLDGKGGYYSYDSLEGTMQRLPTFTATPVEDVKEKVEEEKKEDKQVISSFKDILKLGTQAKAIIIVFAVIVICVIALIVLLIVRAVKLRAYDDYEDYGFEDGDSLFDEINVTDMAQNTQVQTESESVQENETEE